MNAETLKALNNISKRLNEVEQKLEHFLIGKQEITNGGLADIADVINTHDTAIADLAQTINEIAQNK